jgi:predicted nucleotidyltransferase
MRYTASMRPSEVLAQHREAIRQIVQQSGMSNPRLFGSALHGDEIDGSDLDILVDAPPRTSLFDLARLQLALEREVGIKVDVRLPDELHPRFRHAVLAEAPPL